jgi:cytochrome c6
MKKLFSAVLILGLAVPVMAADLSSNADFKTKCAGCHGPEGQKENKAMGITPLKNAASKSDAELTKTITDGKGKMPSYKGKLTDAQIKKIVADIKAQK